MDENFVYIFLEPSCGSLHGMKFMQSSLSKKLILQHWVKWFLCSVAHSLSLPTWFQGRFIFNEKIILNIIREIPVVWESHNVTHSMGIWISEILKMLTKLKKGDFLLDCYGLPWWYLLLSGTIWDNLELSGDGWNSLELTGVGWRWLELAESGWSWLDPAGLDWIWLDLAESDWTWLAPAGASWP